MTTTTTKPRIYVACLSSYNEGRLHGRWIDCSADVHDMYRDIESMLAESPSSFAEEFEIHDSDSGFPVQFIIERGLDGIAEVMQASKANDPEAIAAYISFFSEWDVKHFEEAYTARTENVKEYAVDLFWELSAFNSTVQDELGSYINEDKVLREFEIENTVIKWGEFYYIFRSC